ncbi:whole genome shotgun sequence [Seminavis robusta]|uniref:Whole genome shotgun sequence n=1 Tax=Seminavis robusta TaxID=568900 RepID=A0A9N8DYB0_9STRA|nr:whole genome shotgun sequence [Seminavis robusta]|eukprot:Sro448_g145150.1 whole genome shotgun sequence (872) ;mRNA; f:37104-39807
MAPHARNSETKGISSGTSGNNTTSTTNNKNHLINHSIRAGSGATVGSSLNGGGLHQLDFTSDHTKNYRTRSGFSSSSSSINNQSFGASSGALGNLSLKSHPSSIYPNPNKMKMGRAGPGGVNQEDGSVITSGTFMVMTRPDGSRGCVKHPHLTLDGWTCPECEKEFKQGQQALQARKANLDNRLQALGDGPTPQQQQQQQQQQQVTQPALPSGAHSPMGPMSVQAQQQALYGAANMAGPSPMTTALPYGSLAAGYGGMLPPALAALNGVPGPSGPPSSASSSTSLDTLALQINRMQQMQDWMLLQKEREVQMLRQELAEAQQKLHTNQLEHALLQEKMNQQKIQHEQELKYLQLSTAAQAASNNPNNAVAPAAAVMAPPPAQAVVKNNSTSTESLPALQVMKAPTIAVPKDNTTTKSNANSKDVASSAVNRSIATGTATNTTVPIGTPVTPNKKPPPTTVMAAKVNNISTRNGTSSNPTPEKAAGANDSSKVNGNKAPLPAVATAKNNPPKKPAPTKNPPPAEAPKKNSNPKPPPSSNNNNNPAAQNNKATTNKSTPPPIANISKQTPPAMMNGVPIDINFDDDAPPTVPLQEDITLGTLGKAQSWKATVVERAKNRNVGSDRFEPRYIPQDQVNANATNSNANDKDHDGMEPGAGFVMPSDQQSLTVASSTYGEDRQKVINQSLLDPYGDKGIYTGLILKSTGMPHGSGRMIYEEDQRIYEGEWRHGRWHGFGNAKFANGDSYEGEYRFDQRHGNGKYAWSDGRSYDGAFSEDRRHGKGLFVWPDGAIYEGEFSNGQREGHGSYKFSDGGQYTGSWKDGRYNGFGTCSWEDGRCYRGEWRNGMAHGKGIETYADGTVRHDGQWVDDEPVR